MRTKTQVPGPFLLTEALLFSFSAEKNQRKRHNLYAFVTVGLQF